MELSQGKKQMIEEKLPKDIQKAIESGCMEVADLDKQDIKRIFSKTEETISDILQGEYRYSARDVERITADIFEEYIYKMQNRAEAKRVDTYVNGKGIVTSMAKNEVLKAEEIENSEEKRNALNRSYGNIVGYSEDILNDQNIEARKNYNYIVEELVLTELKSKIKRKMNVYDSQVAEEAFSEISSVLSRRLVGDLEQSFYDNSRDLKRIVSSRVNDVVTEFSQEYAKVSEKEEQNKDNNNKENKDKKLDLSDLVATPEEVQKSEEERLKEKIERVNAMELEDYFK